jgi:hypothetical protein
MVFIDMQVAGRPNAQIEQPVMGDVVEQMIVEAEAGLDVSLPGPVQFQVDQHFGFTRRAVDLRNSAHCSILPQTNEMIQRDHSHRAKRGESDLAGSFCVDA